MSNSSTFPQSNDVFKTLQEPTGADWDNVTRFKYLRGINPDERTPAEIAELAALEVTLVNMIAESSYFNLITDAITNMQSFIVDELFEFYIYKGDWLNTTQYSIFNTVNDLGNIYLAKEDNVNKRPSENPTEWLQIASKGDKGDQGEKGAALLPRGDYSPATAYVLYDLILFQNKLYYALESVIGESPIDSPAKWQLFLDGADANKLQAALDYSIFYLEDTSVTPNQIIVPNITIDAQEIISMAEPLTLAVKVKNGNTGATTIKIGDNAVTSIKKNVTEELEEGNLLTDEIIILIYDGINCQLQKTLVAGSKKDIKLPAYENLTKGDFFSIVDDAGTLKAKIADADIPNTSEAKNSITTTSGNAYGQTPDGSIRVKIYLGSSGTIQLNAAKGAGGGAITNTYSTPYSYTGGQYLGMLYRGKQIDGKHTFIALYAHQSSGNSAIQAAYATIFTVDDDVTAITIENEHIKVSDDKYSTSSCTCAYDFDEDTVVTLYHRQADGSGTNKTPYYNVTTFDFTGVGCTIAKGSQTNWGYGSIYTPNSTFYWLGVHGQGASNYIGFVVLNGTNSTSPRIFYQFSINRTAKTISLVTSHILDANTGESKTAPEIYQANYKLDGTEYPEGDNLISISAHDSIQRDITAFRCDAVTGAASVVYSYNENSPWASQIYEEIVCKFMDGVLIRKASSATLEYVEVTDTNFFNSTALAARQSVIVLSDSGLLTSNYILPKAILFIADARIILLTPLLDGTGVVEKDALSGANAELSVFGNGSNAFTGLSLNKKYYASANGIGTTETSNEIGRAISTTVLV